MACTYCDTAYAREEKPAMGRAETNPGSGEFTEFTNPINAREVVSLCQESGAGVTAITGGEPLVQADFLALLVRELKTNGHRTYLETNGTLHKELSTVIDATDVIAMDIKLPSAGGEELWDAHKQFLEIAKATEVFVKAVVSADTPRDEISRCAEIIAGINPAIPLVIQPMSGEIFSGNSLIRLQEVAQVKLNDVRVIPQCHKALGLL